MIDSFVRESSLQKMHSSHKSPVVWEWSGLLLHLENDDVNWPLVPRQALFEIKGLCLKNY